MSIILSILHGTSDADSDGMFTALLSHSIIGNFCSYNYNTGSFRLCPSLNINYNSAKLFPSGKICLNMILSFECLRCLETIQSNHQNTVFHRCQMNYEHAKLNDTCAIQETTFCGLSGCSLPFCSEQLI